MNELKELFECLDEVIRDYFIPYDSERSEESSMVALFEAYERCKKQAHEMNHSFLPMDSAPRDGTMVLLMGKSVIIYPHSYFERNSNGEMGWCSDTFLHLGDDEFSGWFPIPKPLSDSGAPEGD